MTLEALLLAFSLSVPIVQEGPGTGPRPGAGPDLAALRGELEALRRRHAVPGASIAVLDAGEIVWAEGLGLLKAGGDAVVDAETLFQAGSVSKPVAALAALRLVASGDLELDEDVHEKLFRFEVPASPLRNGKPITLRGLLSHTAGLSVHGFAGYLGNEEVPDLLDVLAGTPPSNSPPIVVLHEPGSKWQYSGGGYCVMQQLMLDVTEQPFPELLAGLVFEPLGMTRSTYEQPLPEELRGNASAGHRFPPKPVPGDAPTHPEMAAAGLWTTPSDLLRFGRALQRACAGAPDAFLPQDLARDALTAVAPSDDYGLGFQLFTGAPADAFGHGGSNQGFKARLFMLRKEERGVAVMTNGDGGGAMLEPAVALVLEAFGWVGEAAATDR